MYCVDSETSQTLKLEQMAAWMEADWIVRRPDQELLIVSAPGNAIADKSVMARYQPDFVLPDGYRFVSYALTDSPMIPRLNVLDDKGEINQQSGAFIYNFAHTNGEEVKVLVGVWPYSDESEDKWQWNLACLAVIPDAFRPVWNTFTTECERLNESLEPEEEVVIIGGRSESFVPTVKWDEIVLPAHLKNDIMQDVSSFFSKGVSVYKRLNLKPFRKLLLAGVPGTGKTMLCSALASWAIESGYLVIYISSARKGAQNNYGSTFDKIEHALQVATKSARPTMILLEELDAYLHDDEKALVLNVLDGNESTLNANGTLLIATTNYPEAIDERILKRPGRLDRIFIIPETRLRNDAEQMLRQYLGSMWRDEHRELVPQLVGYTGAFIREVAVHALTQCAYGDLDMLTLDMLGRSFDGLKEQLDARDDFLKQNRTIGIVPQAAFAAPRNQR